ncbi:MAG TPA: MlaD family protein [Burkholderiales bacterium]|nr:MlaD family protein [Burkholderiales bacterium]
MRRDLKIGIFFTGALIVLAVFIFVVGNLSNLFRRPGYPIYIRYESSLGLDKTAAVKMAGIKIGYVKDIQLEGRRSKVILSIYPKYKIPRGSKAIQSVQGLLGEKYVDVQPSIEDEYLRPGDELVPGPSSGLDQLTPMLNALGNDLQQVARNLREMTGKETRDNFAEAIKNLSELTGEVERLVAENRGRVTQTLTSASDTARSLDERVKDLAQNANATLGEIQRLLQENRGDIRDSVTKLKDVLSKIEESVTLLNKTLDKIQKGEGSVGKLVNDEGLYNEARGAVRDVRRIAETVSNLRPTLDIRGEYLTRSRFLKGILGVGLWYKDKAFVLAQAVRGPVPDRFTFSAQGGMRFGDFAPRAGVIESELGAGLDYYAFKDRLVLSVEGLNWNRATSPVFRTFARFFPQKNVYVVLGLEDFTLAARREVFFGLGVGL